MSTGATSSWRSSASSRSSRSSSGPERGRRVDHDVDEEIAAAAAADMRDTPAAQPENPTGLRAPSGSQDPRPRRGSDTDRCAPSPACVTGTCSSWTRSSPSRSNRPCGRSRVPARTGLRAARRGARPRRTRSGAASSPCRLPPGCRPCSVFSSMRRPSPRQSGHGCAITSPRPPHTWHGPAVTICPRIDWRTWRTCPAPPHWAHVCADWSPAPRRWPRTWRTRPRYGRRPPPSSRTPHARIPDPLGPQDQHPVSGRPCLPGRRPRRRTRRRCHRARRRRSRTDRRHPWPAPSGPNWS